MRSLLQLGRHFINQPNMRWIGFKKLTTECYILLVQHRIVIPDGKITRDDNGKPTILKQGQVYNISSPYFRYVNSELTSPVIYTVQSKSLLYYVVWCLV